MNLDFKKQAAADQFNHKACKVEFAFGQDANSKHDLFVIDYASRMALVERVAKRPSVKDVLTEALKELKKHEGETEEAAPQVIRIPYDGKGALIAVILQGSCTSFALQTAMRKAFHAVLSQSVKEEAKKVETVNFAIIGLKDTLARSVLNWVSALAVMGRFQMEVFGKKAKDAKKFPKLNLHIQSPVSQAAALECLEEGRILGAANNQVRYLAELPSNVLNPNTYSEFAQGLAKDLKVKAVFHGVKELKKRDAGAFLAVVKADLNQVAGIMHLKFDGGVTGRKNKSSKKVAIVGKGLCFDTGGYNVKTGDFMYNMHRDMTGSAVALSLFRTLVEMDVPYEVNVYLALAENLISHEGFRPNDVVIASNGMSIEVVDTDAEGRMVLSDTLVMASEEKPDLIIDFATLTGSVVRSLDTRRCGSYSNRTDLGALSVKVGEECGERVWSFPIGQDYNDALKSETADIRQCASSSAADHIYAATFLSKFVGKDIPWIHIDLAADTNKGGLGLAATENTGFGVRFGASLIQAFLG
jgi:leucyl aminopeptidase